MKVYCPSCQTIIPATGIDLSAGWGKCAACQEVFPLSTMIPGFSASSGVNQNVHNVVERPFNARAIVDQSERDLDIFVPPQGFRVGTLGMLGFALFWLAFIAFWTCGALGLFGGGGPPQAFNIGFASFSIPFWLVGFGMLGGVIWAAFGTKRVKFDQIEMQTQIRCLLYSRERTIDRDLVQSARLYSPSVQSDSSRTNVVSGAEIVFEKGSFVVPADDPAEATWLVSVINEFLQK